MKLGYLTFVILPLAILLIALSCEKADILEHTPEKNSSVILRGGVMNIDSIGFMHNDFIEHIYENHLDSTSHYLGNDLDFKAFLERKFESHFNEQVNIASHDVMMHADTFLITLANVQPKNSIENWTYWTAEEYDSLEVMYDKLHDVFTTMPFNINTVLDTFETSRSHIDDFDFGNEAEILLSLDMWKYSLEAADYIINEQGGSTDTDFAQCLWFAVKMDRLMLMAASDGYDEGSLSLEEVAYVTVTISLEGFFGCIDIYY